MPKISMAALQGKTYIHMIIINQLIIVVAIVLYNFYPLDNTIRSGWQITISVFPFNREFYRLPR